MNRPTIIAVIMRRKITDQRGNMKRFLKISAIALSAMVIIFTTWISVNAFYKTTVPPPLWNEDITVFPRPPDRASAWVKFYDAYKVNPDAFADIRPEVDSQGDFLYDVSEALDAGMDAGEASKSLCMMVKQQNTSYPKFFDMKALDILSSSLSGRLDEFIDLSTLKATEEKYPDPPKALLFMDLFRLMSAKAIYESCDGNYKYAFDTLGRLFTASADYSNSNSMMNRMVGTYLMVNAIESIKAVLVNAKIAGVKIDVGTRNALMLDVDSGAPADWWLKYTLYGLYFHQLGLIDQTIDAADKQNSNWREKAFMALFDRGSTVKELNRRFSLYYDYLDWEPKDGEANPVPSFEDYKSPWMWMYNVGGKTILNLFNISRGYYPKDFAELQDDFKKIRKLTVEIKELCADDKEK